MEEQEDQAVRLVRLVQHGGQRGAEFAHSSVVVAVVSIPQFLAVVFSPDQGHIAHRRLTQRLSQGRQVASGTGYESISGLSSK